MNTESNSALVLIKTDEEMQPYAKYIAVGLDDSLISQLIEKSRQPNILSSTPRDANERFGDRTMFDKWFEKGKTIHWLVGSDGDLAGIIWYGTEAYPGNSDSGTPETTFAVRLYDNYTGKRLSVPFMKQSLKILSESDDSSVNAKGIWLQTDSANKPALAAYEKFGYKKVEEVNSKVLMILEPATLLSLVK